MRKCILIVDDDEDMLVLMQKFLEKFTSEYKVHTTTSGKDVSRLIKELNADLLITDILMPDKDGLEILREVKQQYPSLKVVAISAGGTIRSSHYLRLAESLGASCTLNKPFNKDEFISAIRQAFST